MKRSRINPVSDRRLSERLARQAVVEDAFTRDGWTCQARDVVVAVRCGGELDAHERIPRSAWRAGYLVLSNVVTVCRRHHDWIGDHPAEAHALGLHGFSWETPT